MTPLDRVMVASRVFALAAISGLVLAARDPQMIVSLIIIAAVASTAAYISFITPRASPIIVPLEAAVTGLVIGLALPGGTVALPYLVVLSLIAGISGGIVGVSAVVVVQFLTVGFATIALAPATNSHVLLEVLGPWLLTSIGVGLLGSWLQGVGKIPQPASDASYEAAHRLLTQLRTVARRLSSGLDPVTIATHVREEISEAVSATELAVFVRTEGGTLSPLVYSSDAARELSTDEAIIADCWATMEPVVAGAAGQVVALPLRVASRMIGVTLVRCGTAPPPATLKELMRKLDEHSLRLETALTFDEVRSIATVEERHRLAREIHDGIAQEIASLGYQVDELLANSESEHQRRALTALRQEFTRVVSELRLSIFDLRSAVLSETGLGAALSEYVRQIGTRSAFTVHLSLAEVGTRLRAETEAELLRIAQEAITNARKHSGASNLWVDCRVQPPCARLEIRDDGAGPTLGRSDSYGLKIMRERADRLGATLEIRPASDHTQRPGTLVRVILGEWRGIVPATGSEAINDAIQTDARLARGRS